MASLAFSLKHVLEKGVKIVNFTKCQPLRVQVLSIPWEEPRFTPRALHCMQRASRKGRGPGRLGLTQLLSAAAPGLPERGRNRHTRLLRLGCLADSPPSEQSEPVTSIKTAHYIYCQ